MRAAMRFANELRRPLSAKAEPPRPRTTSPKCTPGPGRRLPMGQAALVIAVLAALAWAALIAAALAVWGLVG